MGLLGVAAALTLVAPAARAQTAAAPSLQPKASILVDAETGAVISGVNVHEPLRPASLTKIMTALTAVEHLAPGTSIPISSRAAGMPAHNLNMKEGQVWRIEDVLGALLVSSANDAGMALAERVSGSAEAFGAALNATARRLGMTDDPVLQDPSGLDDEFSVSGGNRISARDLAIAARAVLNEPRLSGIVATKVYSFTGPDGVAHRLGNHNRLLKLYDGAIGMKTGYTKRAMHGLVAAATRNGRTMISVILDAPGDTYGPSAALLDHGFATPVSAEATLDHLPTAARASTAGGALAQQGGTASLKSDGVSVSTSSTTPSKHSATGTLFKFFVFTLFVVVVLRGRVKVRAIRRRDPGWPHLRVPEVKLPEVTLRKVTLPKVALPKFSLAKIRVPRPQLRSRMIDLRAQVPKIRTSAPALPRKRVMAAPQHAHPRSSRPRPAHRGAPAHSARAARKRTSYDPPPLDEIDPKLAQRFEILARTGQVTK